ncbi:LysM peptidoglycan-binding domain-containing protein [Auritidibacter ignavus]|uniref:LysM peptidoglycan-binding domain-containing protein n=1 Tax=Auritidibacter ignavus TaxID=678932 RepID=UPI00109CA4D3|nr:LysM peptidoglycan-binding domain-containing protein [Auritidibacter ignavus]
MTIANHASTSVNAMSLTRRGRLVFRAVPLAVVATLLVGFFAMVLFGWGNPSAEASHQSHQAGMVTLTVGYGDTLWSIAGEIAPEEPRADVVTRIAELNDLETSDIAVGDKLFVPRYQ